MENPPSALVSSEINGKFEIEADIMKMKQKKKKKTRILYDRCFS